MSFVTASKKRNDIQMLRAIAVVAVIVFHLDESWMRGGFLGVDVFFVISGFLITGIITRGLSDGKFSLSNFYLRRIKRLFPALALVLWVTLLFAIICFPPLPFEGLTDHLQWAALQVSNFSFMRGVDYFGASNETNPVLHTWSLGVEEQFYLTWAPFLAFCYWLRGRWKPKKGHFRPVTLMVSVVVIGIVAEFFTLTKFGETVSFFSPFSRMWELGLGGLASTVVGAAGKRFSRRSHINLLSGCGYLAVLISVVWLSEAASANPLMRAIPCLGTFLALLFPIQFSTERLRPVLKGGVYLGDMSYSLYLWHWPVICLAPYLTNLPDSPRLLVITVLLIVGLAVASYHLCEKRFMADPKWKNFVSLRSSTAIGALMIVGGGGYALRTEENAGWRFDLGEVTAEEAAWRGPLESSVIRAESGSDSLYSKVSDAKVVLIGDSHARHFAPVVQAWVDEVYGGDLFIFTQARFFAPGTHVAQRVIDGKGKEIRVDSTSEVSRQLLQTIVESEKVKVVFVAQRTGLYTMPLLPCDAEKLDESYLFDEADPDSGKSSEEIYENQIHEFVGHLAESGKSVVLMGQATPLPWLPKPGSSILDRVLKRDLEIENILLPQELAGRVDLEDRVYRKAAVHSEVYYLPTREIITRAFSEDGRYLYRDYNHLRYHGAMSVFQPLRNLLQPLTS